MTFKTATILKAVGDERLKLYRGNGYWYFVFDDDNANKVFDTHSIYVMRLSDLPLEQWIEEGREFLEKQKARGTK